MLSNLDIEACNCKGKEAFMLFAGPVNNNRAATATKLTKKYFYTFYYLLNKLQKTICIILKKGTSF